MNDQQIPPAQNTESGFETKVETPRDFGEASPIVEEPLTNAEIAVDNQDKAEVLFNAAEKNIQLMVELKVVTQETAENFAINGLPTIRELQTRYKDVKQEIKDQQDSQVDMTNQLRSLAEWAISLQYTVAALIQKEFKPFMYKTILDISRSLKDLSDTNSSNNLNRLKETFSGLGRMASVVEELHATAEHHIRELVDRDKTNHLRTICDGYNDELIKYLGRSNQYLAQSDQSSRELSRFIENELVPIISLDRIHAIQSKIEERYLANKAKLQDPSMTSAGAPQWESTKTDTTGVAANPFWSSDQTIAGGWQKSDSTQPGSMLTYEPQVGEPSQVGAPDDEFDKLVAVAQAKNPTSTS